MARAMASGASPPGTSPGSTSSPLAARPNSVRTGPGLMTVTWMPWGSSSRRRPSLKPTTANLVAE
jgi:hypothetical protein